MVLYSTYEATVLVTVSVEVAKGLLRLKVLELHNHVGEDVTDSLHELVHESLLLLVGRALLSQTQVEGVLEVLLIVGTAVEDDGEGLLGVDTSSAGVKSELADLQRNVSSLFEVREPQDSTYRDTDTVDAQVTETKDTRAVCHDANLGFLAGPVSEHSPDGLALLDGDVQSLGASVDARVLEADITNGGSIDEGHEVADVVDEEAVEEVGVGLLDGGEVEVLVDGSLAGVDHLHGSGALRLEALHGVGEEASEVLGGALLGSEGETWRG